MWAPAVKPFAPQPSLAVYTYDNHDDAVSLYGSMLAKSASRLGVRFHVGALVPNRNRRYKSADRPRWLQRELQTASTEVVMMADASDMILVCNASEMLAARRKLGSMEDVLVGGEPNLWPGQIRYRGVLLKGAGSPYPPAIARGNVRSPLRYVNAGGQIGSPKALLGLMRCMGQLFPGFPDNCPADSAPTTGGGASTFTAFWNDTTPYFHSKTVVLSKTGWGWDQACFQMYLMEQVHGLLPKGCPRMVIDYAADFFLSVGGSGKIEWQSEAGRARPTLKLTGGRPCVLHGNGVAGKPAIKRAMRAIVRIDRDAPRVN